MTPAAAASNVRPAAAVLVLREPLFTGADTARGAAWPAQPVLRLGADCTLRVADDGAPGRSLLLVEGGICFGAATAGAQWHVPTRGFMRRIHPR